MDPAEERRETKRNQEYINMLGYVADSQHGIPRRCPCGGRMIDEVRGKEDYDTLHGKRFFTCVNYEPWVLGVQEEIQCLRKRVEEAEHVMKWVPNLNNQLESQEAQVNSLTGQVDILIGQVYNLRVQVAHLEKLCFE